jgi:hypothetical protein
MKQKASNDNVEWDDYLSAELESLNVFDVRATRQLRTFGAGFQLES